MTTPNNKNHDTKKQKQAKKKLPLYTEMQIEFTYLTQLDQIVNKKHAIVNLPD